MVIVEMNGRMESSLMWIGDKKLQWSFKDKNGTTIRFTEDYSVENTWKEIGEVTMNGDDWYQFFEMTLNKM